MSKLYPVKIGQGRKNLRRVYAQAKNGAVWFSDWYSPQRAEQFVAEVKQNPRLIQLKGWSKCTHR
jgi:hypothetical protein